MPDLCQMAMSDGKSCQNTENSPEVPGLNKILPNFTQYHMCMSSMQLPYSDVFMFDPRLKPDDHMENQAECQQS